MPANPAHSAAKQAHNQRRRELRRQGGLDLSERPSGLRYIRVHNMLFDRWSNFRQRYGGLATDEMLRGEAPDTRPQIYFMIVLDDGVNEGAIDESQVLNDQAESPWEAWLLVSQSSIPVIAYIVVEGTTDDDPQIAEEYFSTTEYNALLAEQRQQDQSNHE